MSKVIDLSISFVDTKTIPSWIANLPPRKKKSQNPKQSQRRKRLSKLVFPPQDTNDNYFNQIKKFLSYHYLNIFQNASEFFVFSVNFVKLRKNLSFRNFVDIKVFFFTGNDCLKFKQKIRWVKQSH